MIVVGKVAGYFGVRGWCKIFSHTSPRDNILNYSPWYLRSSPKQDWYEVKVVQGKPHGKGIVALFEGRDSRDDVAALMQYEIGIRQSQLESLPSDEYYWSQLIGLKVVTINGDELGNITSMMETGANDVIIVNGDKERLIPFVQGQYVMSIDLDAGQMVVDWDPEF